MNVRTLFLAGMIVALAGCGGSAPMQAAAPAQTPTPAVVHAPARSNVVAFMGDSITHRWFTMPLIDGAVEVNLGVVGNVTAQMWGRFQVQVINAQPQVGIVVIEGGTNDIVDGVAGTIDNISTMAQMATDAGIKVILCTVPPDTQAVLDSTASSSQAEVYSKENTINDALFRLAAQKGYLIADYHDVLIKDDGTQDESLFVDGEHPNQAGYDLMWKVLLPLIQEDLQ